MNKQIILSLIAATMVAPTCALAQTSGLETQIYGYLNVGVDNYEATGSTTGKANDLKARNGVYENISRLGFRGKKSLITNVSAIWQIEAGLSMDSGDNTTKFSTGTLASRDSFLGVQGNWGALTLGRQSLWYLNGGFPDYSAWQDDSNYLLRSFVPFLAGYFGRGMGNANGVPFRQSNVVKYTSPSFNNFRAILAYQPNGETSQANTNTDGRLVALTVEGGVGPVAGGWDYANNRANSPSPGTPAFAAGNGQGETIANKLRIGWTYEKNALISVLWVSTQQKNGGQNPFAGQGGLPETYIVATGAGADLKQTGWAIEWKHRFGDIQPIVQWGKTSNISGCKLAVSKCDHTSSTSWNAGARYILNEGKSWVYAQYSTIRNDSNANLDFVGTGSYQLTSTNTQNGLTAASAGADPRLLSIGVVHSF